MSCTSGSGLECETSVHESVTIPPVSYGYPPSRPSPDTSTSIRQPFLHISTPKNEAHDLSVAESMSSCSYGKIVYHIPCALRPCVRLHIWRLAGHADLDLTRLYVGSSLALRLTSSSDRAPAHGSPFARPVLLIVCRFLYDLAPFS